MHVAVSERHAHVQGALLHRGAALVNSERLTQPIKAQPGDPRLNVCQGGESGGTHAALIHWGGRGGGLQGETSM